MSLGRRNRGVQRGREDRGAQTRQDTGGRERGEFEL